MHHTFAKSRRVYLAWVVPVASILWLFTLLDWEHAVVTEVALRLKADPLESLQDIQHILEGHPYVVGPEHKSPYVVGADERFFMFKPNTYLRVAYTPRQKIVVDHEIIYQRSHKVDLNDIEGTWPPDVNWPSNLLGMTAGLAAWAAAWELANWCDRKQATPWRILGYGIATLCIIVLVVGYLYACMVALFTSAI